jgi:hypothetical protein
VAPWVAAGAFVPWHGAAEPLVIVGTDYFFMPRASFGTWTSFRSSETRLGTRVGYLFPINRTLSIWSTVGFSVPLAPSILSNRVSLDLTTTFYIKLPKGDPLGLGIGYSAPMDDFLHSLQSFARAQAAPAMAPLSIVSHRSAPRRR